MPKFLAKLTQLFYGDPPMFGLETFSMLSAQVFDDGEITARFTPVQTFAYFRQNEGAGLAALVDGNHVGRTGWSNVRTKSRAGRGRARLIAIIGQEFGEVVQIIQERGGTASMRP